jgi:hypothetical protein
MGITDELEEFVTAGFMPAFMLIAGITREKALLPNDEIGRRLIIPCEEACTKTSVAPSGLIALVGS